jgi:2-polyprenyl-3-methyl-5-hydroxy-6-metoxy-1,4-benzoquinol methylase
MKEEEIRPKAIFDRYLELAREDTVTFFSNKDDFDNISCPACETDDADVQFEKEGFTYVLCKNCGTLYANPRPGFEIIQQYYKNSKSTKYWAEHFYKDTEEQRREKIFRPRAIKISEFIKNNFINKPEVFVDIGAGYGAFLEEIKKLNAVNNIIAIEPSDDLAGICREKGFQVIQSPLEKVGGILRNKVSIATSFELFEHLHDPKQFLSGVREILSENGYFILTTLNIEGFDLQVLWEKSHSISPPHHLNFFNLNSIEYLLQNSGFKVVKKTTPGYLDVDIVKNAYKDGIRKGDRFTQHLIEKSDDDTLEKFQGFLRENKLSSHMCIIARKDI